MELFERLLDDAKKEPIKYIRHDVNAHADDALLDLCLCNGIAAYGMYWLLSEKLMEREGHYYDLSTTSGAYAFRRDMSALGDVTMEECESFVDQLAERGLVAREWWLEDRKVAIGRILRDSEDIASKLASRRLGAVKTNERKLKNAERNA